MADTSLDLLLIHGTKKLSMHLVLPPGEEGELLVRHLAAESEYLTGIPPAAQRLIHRGKSLVDADAHLSQYGLKNGHKVMLIGKKLSLLDEGHMKTLRSASAEVTKYEKKVADLVSELDGIHRGFLPAPQQQEALPRLAHRVCGVAEALAHLIEALDAITLIESAADVRQKRKDVINSIQSLLQKCDDLSGKIEATISGKESES